MAQTTLSCPFGTIHLEFSGEVPRSPFFQRVLFEMRLCLGQIVFLADPLYFWTRALRPTGLENQDFAHLEWQETICVQLTRA